MNQKSSPIQMVVGYDFSNTAQVSLDRAIGLARSEPEHLMHVIVVLGDKGSPGILEKKGKVTYEDAVVVQETVERYLATKLETLAPEFDVHYFVHVRLGSPAEEILRLCQEVGAHIVLVGSHGRTGLSRVFMGSVSEKVAREAKCPVLVVRSRDYDDVDLAVIVDAPEGHAEEHPYVRPSLHAYRNRRVEKQDDAWTIFNR
jgi:nucleotide-binding universal stress UspA family protein